MWAFRLILCVLSGWTRKLIEHAKEITDENEDLCHFCKCLENCLQKGLLPSLDSVGYLKVPYAWHWLEYVAVKNYRWCDFLILSWVSIYCLLFNANVIFSGYNTFLLVVEQVKQNAKVHTSAGRLRLLIRICLVRKCLHMPVEILVRHYVKPN